jgi:hypothetical protein
VAQTLPDAKADARELTWSAKKDNSSAARRRSATCTEPVSDLAELVDSPRPIAVIRTSGVNGAKATQCGPRLDDFRAM